jgi:hypothetical protein
MKKSTIPSAEQINDTLKAVRAAKEQVRALRTPDFPLGSERRELIEAAFWQLDEIEGDLLLQQVDSAVEELEADGKSLVSLADKMKKSIAGLESVAKGISTAATAIQTIVNLIQNVAKVV